MIAQLLTGGAFTFLGKAIDKIFPDPEQKANAKALLMQAQVNGDLATLNAEMQVMLAEAKSQDKWTSRARPSFLYVIYLMILTAIPMGVIYAVDPQLAANITTGVQAWLAAIPKELWTLFGMGYLGYVGGRTYDKKKVLDSLTNIGK